MDHPAGRPTPTTDPGDPPRRSGLAPRRVLVTAFGISLVLHLAVIAVYPLLMRPDPDDARPSLQPTSPVSPDGMRVVEVVAIDEQEEAEAPAEPVVPDPVRPQPAPEATPGPRAGAVDDPLVPPGPSAAERLRVNLEDARLWAPVDPSLTELTPEQRAELALAGLLEAWNDSVRAAEEARRALTDWTYTDSEGGRWGVADGKLYLGDLALPFPFSFGMNPQQLEEARLREWEWAEIQRGALTGEVRDSWKERAQAIRERRDRERARADTSGVRR